MLILVYNEDSNKIEKYVNTFQNADGTFGSEDISTLTIMEIDEDILDDNLNVDTIKFANAIVEEAMKTYKEHEKNPEMQKLVNL